MNGDYRKERERVLKMLGEGLLTISEDKVFLTGTTSTKKEC